MIGRFRHFTALWVAGILILAFVTWACFQLRLNVTTTGFSCLIVTVLLSLLDSYVPSVLFSIVATGCLDYFVTEPLFSFTVASVEDTTVLAAFLITSLAQLDERTKNCMRLKWSWFCWPNPRLPASTLSRKTSCDT